MSDLIIPEEFKKLTLEAETVSLGFRVVKNGAIHDLISKREVDWVKMPLTCLLILVFANIIFNAPSLFDVKGMTIPTWVPWSFNAAIVLTCIGVLCVQVQLKKNNSPWLGIDTEASEVILYRRMQRRIPFDEIKRVHLASEIIRYHTEGHPDRRAYELSLLVKKSEEAELERIALLHAKVRSIALDAGDAIKKLIGHRSGEIEAHLESGEEEEEP